MKLYLAVIDAGYFGLDERTKKFFTRKKYAEHYIKKKLKRFESEPYKPTWIIINLETNK